MPPREVSRALQFKTGALRRDDGAKFFLVDPEFQGGIADAQHARDFARLQHLFF